MTQTVLDLTEEVIDALDIMAYEEVMETNGNSDDQEKYYQALEDNFLAGELSLEFLKKWYIKD